jgi:hypothetical protein
MSDNQEPYNLGYSKEDIQRIKEGIKNQIEIIIVRSDINFDEKLNILEKLIKDYKAYD